MKINRILHIALLMELSLVTLGGAQTAIAPDPSLDPHLFLTLQDFEARKAIAQREPWAKAALAAQGGRRVSAGLSQQIRPH